MWELTVAILDGLAYALGGSEVRAEWMTEVRGGRMTTAWINDGSLRLVDDYCWINDGSLGLVDDYCLDK